MQDDALERWLGEEPAPVTVTVSPQDIARFAVAIGATDPSHFDDEAARARGHPSIVAPDLFYLSLRTGTSNLVPQHDLHEEGTARRDIPPFPYRTAMAGSSRVVLNRRFLAGETVGVECRRVHAARKEGRSGPLTFVTFLYRYTDAQGTPIATEQFTRIFT